MEKKIRGPKKKVKEVQVDEVVQSIPLVGVCKDCKSFKRNPGRCTYDGTFKPRKAIICHNYNKKG